MYAERKTAEFRKIYNKMIGKFSKENKPVVPLNIYELHFLCSNLQLCINSVPYNSKTRMSPAILLHARGLVNEFLFRETEEAEHGTKPMKPLYNWLEEIRRF